MFKLFQRTILDLICEIVGLKFPTWTDEVSVALSAVDPSCPKDSWRLQEGFVVDEVMSVLPHLATSTLVHIYLQDLFDN